MDGNSSDFLGDFMFHGVINIYKEPGFTSHDVVAKLRGILRQKKIGHTGTLDPAAEGVLPVCLGKGTKLCDLLTDKRKTYQAVLLLGTETDTQDTTGTILSEKPTEQLTEPAVRGAAESFVGPYMQVPPMYSALKVNGKKLYELARAGKEVERAARPVEIYDLQIDAMELPRVTMTVTCSKGTYIRTLCHDIGEKLGCGGCMEKLIRTRVDRFVIGDSLRLSEVEALAKAGQIEDRIVPVDGMFEDCPAYVSESEVLDKLLQNGNPFPKGLGPRDGCLVQIGSSLAEHQVSADGNSEMVLPDSGIIRVYDSANQFIGLYAYQPEKKQWKEERTDKFLPDPDVRGAKAYSNDYTKSGYDRGHMAPAADMKWSKQAMAESFYMSNICPQNPNLNRGDWNDLEEKSRQWAKKYGAVYIACGPVYDHGKPKRIGNNKVAVPDAFYKVILINDSKTPQAIGFLFPNKAGHKPLKKYIVTVDSVEKRTGIDFFPALPDEVENRIEAEPAKALP